MTTLAGSIFKGLLISVLLLVLTSAAGRRIGHDAQKNAYDIVIYGGTSAGIIAGYTAKQMGKSVIVVEPTSHIGGLTTGGLGATDIGNKYAVTGIAKDFYRRLGTHYGKFEQWLFEPGAAGKIFDQYIDRAGLEIVKKHRLETAVLAGKTIKEIVVKNLDNGAERKIAGKVFIDATYEGDLMAKAGVSYAVGREANTGYNETINGVQLMHGHQMPDGIDPYKVPGDPASGLLWGISPEILQPAGSGDDKLQAYNFRICLTSNPENRLPIVKPERYDAAKYELLVRLFAAQPEKRKLTDYFAWSRMPNQKTDINNKGGFSTDMIGMNHGYADAGYERREEIIRDHIDYTKGLLYFFANDPRVPEEIRDEIKDWGYPKDEYTDNGHWTPQLYLREVRRMKGAYVMTQANCQGKEIVEDGIGMAAYTMDSHNCQRIVIEKDGKKMVKNEGNVEVGGFPPYPISYRSLTPRENECTNLLVPVCLSASHIAYGSIRMEPVFMALGQSSAVAASMAVDKGTSVQKIDVKALQKELKDNPLADGSPAEILVDDQDKACVLAAGDWKVVKGGVYGPTALEAQPGSGASIRFTPAAVGKGTYDVYVYFSVLPGVSDQVNLRVSDGTKVTKHTIRKADVVIEGQTRGKWHLVGPATVKKGGIPYVEYTTDGADGRVIADAVIWKAKL